MRKSKIESKDSAINVRLPTSQKKKYMEEAKLCNMTLSNYVLHVLQNKKVTIIKNGGEIARAMYDLSSTLNQCLKCAEIPVDIVQVAVTDSVNKLNDCMATMTGEEDVNIKI